MLGPDKKKLGEQSQAHIIARCWILDIQFYFHTETAAGMIW